MISFTIELGLKSTIFPFCHMSLQYKLSFMGMPILSEAKALGTKLGSLPELANPVSFTVGTQNYYCFQNLEFIDRITEFSDTSPPLSGNIHEAKEGQQLFPALLGKGNACVGEEQRQEAAGSSHQ